VTRDSRSVSVHDRMAHHGLESRIVVAESDFTEDAGYRLWGARSRAGVADQR